MARVFPIAGAHPDASASPLDALIEEFVSRLERGEEPSIDEFARRVPGQENELRRILATACAMVSLKDETASVLPGIIADDSISSGNRALGEFRLLREIGRGGMGIVFEAEQISLGRRIALKVLPFSGILDARHVERFKNEARAAATLEHPHIVHVYSVGQERGLHYYAMQLIEGQTLAEYIQKMRGCEGDLSASGGRVDQGRISTLGIARQSTIQPDGRHSYCRQVARWGIEAAEALEYAHQMGIVHRDIKPSNLLINAEGRLWVADFGLATTLTDSGLTITGDLLGTLRYMSPEQISGLRSFVDQRTDVYSLGITLYELLALAPAFSATERAELIRQVKEDDPSPGPLRQRGVPRELEVVVFKAASKDVSTRYATAQALADDLQRYLDDRPILARRPSPFEQFRKWSRRHQTLTRSLILAAIVSVCSMAAATGLILHERQKAELERLARQAESAVAEAERKNLRQQQYVNEINLAENAVRRNDMTEAARYLNESVPAEGDQNLRGFEWRYLSALSRCAVLEIGRHQGAAYTVMPSPTEDVFASCGQDGIRIWDRRTNSLLKTLTAHANEVNTVNFSPDGRQMISTGDDFEGLVWETHTWSILARLPHTGQAFGGGFTSDGRLLLTGERQEDIMGIPTGENVVRVWNAKTWEQVAVLGGHNNRLTAGDLSDDGKIAMTGDRDGRVKIWKMPEGKLQREFQHFEAGPSKSLMRIVESIDLAHRHPWFVTAGLFSIVEVGNINDGSPIAQVQTHGTIRSARFSPDDSYLVITGDINGIFGTVRVWEITATGDFKEISALTFPKVIWSLVFLNDDEVVFSSGDGAVYRWRLPYRLLERRLRSETPDTTSSAAVSPDGRWLARTGDRLEVQPFDDPSQSIVLDPEAADSTVAFSPDGRLLVRERGGACTFWSTETWRFAFSTDPRAGVDFTEPRKRLQFIDGGRRMQADWVGGGKGVWDLPPSVWPRQFAGDPVTDSELPASFRWAEKDAPGIYEMHHGGRILWRFKIPHVRTFEVSPDGLLFAAGLTDGRIDLYDAASGAIATSCVGTGEPVVGMMFSPSCRTLASSGESGNQITLWHVPTGRRLITINPRLSRIQSFFFTPDEDSLVAAGQNVAGHGEVVIFSTRPAQ